MQHTDRCIGRDRELAQMRIGIGDGTDGLRLSMLTGPSGLGKTTLSRVAVSEAAARGYRVATALGRAGSLSTPFAPWREALPEFADLLAEAARPDATLDIESLGSRLVAVLAELTTEQPLLLVFDDAQALDESSLALLPYAVGVSERMNLSILIVEQNDAVDIPASYRAFVDGLVARRVVSHLELGPMSDDSIFQLIHAYLELEVDADIPGEIILRAQGNPWFAQELAEAWRRGTSEIPVSIAAAATSRLNGLVESAQDLVYAIALGYEGAHIGWIEGLSAEKPRQFVRTMEAIKASGLVREDGEVLTIAHPLMQQALLDELSAAMKRALHVELAEVIASTTMNEVTAARALGYHLGQAGKLDQAVDHFLRAAEANEILGQLHEALVDYDRALQAEPRIEQRSLLLKQCAYAAMQTGSDRATEYWNELGRVAAARNDNELYAYALFQQYWTSNDGTALDRLERAALLGPSEYGWSARAAACLCTLEADYRAAIEHDVRALELAKAKGDPILEALALDKLGMAYAYIGEHERAIESLQSAVAISTTYRLHGWVWVARIALAETLAENLQSERSLSEAQACVRYVEDLNLARVRPVVESAHALALMRCGLVDEAMVGIDRAFNDEVKFPPNQHTALVYVARAQIAIEQGDPTVSAPAVASALEATADNGYASWIYDPRLPQALLNAITGDSAGALEAALALDIDEPVGRAHLTRWLLRLGIVADLPDAIEAARARRSSLIATCKLDELLIAEIDSALSALDGGDVEAMRHVARSFDEAGRKLDAQRTRLVIGKLQIRAGASAEAISTLTEVRSTCATVGANYDADIAAQFLRSLGTRSRAKSRSTQVGNLTKRELQIARLVASGLKNSEVASQLFLAEKTVAAHLSNIYGKLEVRSRVQLTAWLQENDTEAMAV